MVLSQFVPRIGPAGWSALPFTGQHGFGADDDYCGIFSFQPFSINQAFAGYPVTQPMIIAICIMNQKTAMLG